MRTLQGFLPGARASIGSALVLFPALLGAAAGTDADLTLGGAVAIVGNGFESGECSSWSESSNPRGGPDVDEDEYGNQNQPTVYCQLPAVYAPNFTDCNDGDDAIHPGAFEACNGVDDDCNPG